MEDLSRDADVRSARSVGSIYAHFSDKEGVYAELIDRALRLNRNYNESGFEQGNSPLGHSQRRLDHEQPLDMAVAADGRAEGEGEEHAGKAGGGGNGDAGRALLDRQVLARELAHRAEHERLGDGDRQLSRHRSGKGLAAETDQTAGGHQRPRPDQHRPEVAVGQATRRDRQDDVEERKTLASQPTAPEETP